MTNLTWITGTLPLESVTNLVTTAERHDGFKAISDQALLEARRGERDVLLSEADAPDSMPHALGIVGGGELDLLVNPRVRGRRIGSDMFRKLMERATEVQPSGAIKVWVHGAEQSGGETGRDAAEHLLKKGGFAPVRTLLRLQLDGAALAGRPRQQHKLSLEPYTKEAAPEIVRVNAASFASHPEQGRLTLEGFLDITHEPWFQPDDLLLLWEGEDALKSLTAFTWIKTVVSDTSTETELYVIGVHPDAAGRGIGTRLLDATLDRMAEHDPHRVTLYVEGDNEPALALYRRAGFTTLQRSRQWALRAHPEEAEPEAQG